MDNGPGRVPGRCQYGASNELEGEEDPFQGDHLHAIRINDEFTVDVLPSVAGVPFAKLEKHIQWLQMEGERIPVLDLQGLSLTKQGVHPKDQSDAQLLKAAIAAAEDRDRSDSKQSASHEK